MRGIFVILLPLVLAGCVSRAPERTVSSSAPRIAFHEVPEDQELASRALEISTSDFVRIQELLGVESKPGPALIGFRQIWRPNVGPMSGYTSGRVIQLNPNKLKAKPARFAFVLRHEMTHLLQNYQRGAPLYWIEGIADYVAYQLAEDKGSECRCTGEFPHYAAGYGCAAALLLHIEDTSPGSVKALHGALVRGSYSDEWFEGRVGKSLSVLWQEFKQTERFTPEAADRLALEQAISGRKIPHSEAAQLHREFLAKRPAGRQIIEAGDFLRDLAAKGQLPGFKNRVPKQMALEKDDFEETDPLTPRVIRFLSESGKIRYCYRVARTGPGAPMRLIEAWSVHNRDGRIIQRYPIAP